MTESDAPASPATPSRERGRKWDRTAVVGILVAAGTGLLASSGRLAEFVQNVETITSGTHRICQNIGLCKADAPPRPVPSNPAAASRPPPNSGHGTFVQLGADATTAPLAARLRRTLDLEGVELAASPVGAARIVELATPVASPAQMAPEGGPRLYGVVVTLQALVRGQDPGEPPIAVIHRQARGFGATPAEAREMANLNAADLLGRRLAESLQ